jgi:spermidine/putrescine transport system substrate-binding protein
LKKITLIPIIFLAITLASSFTISSLAGCKSTTPKQLDVCVWEGYLPEATAALFEQETGIKLNITFVSENAEMYTLLKAGGKADIIMPSHNIVNRYYENGLAQPLNLKSIPNYEKVSKSFREQPWAKWDGSRMGSGEIYVIPYVFGTTGLVVNTSRYTRSLDDIGWEVLFDTDFKGRVSTGNGLEPITMMLDLYDIPVENLISDTQGTLDKIRDKAIALKNNVLKFYKTGSEISDLMKNEEVWASQIWDGIGKSLSTFDAKFKYILPKEGGQGWADTFMIPKDAANPEEAYLLIDFMLRPDIAAMLTEQSGFTTTIEGALDIAEIINKDFYRYTDEQMVNLVWTPNLSEEAISIYTTFWEEISTVQ